MTTSKLEKKQNRKTHAEQAQDLVATGALKTRLVDVEGLSVYLGMSANTLRSAITELPNRWTKETLKAAIAKGIVAPPVRMVGKKQMFWLDEVDAWIKMLPVKGLLPEEEVRA